MVTLRADKRKKGYSLYLDIYSDGKRRFERLKIYVSQDYTKPLKDEDGKAILDKKGKPKRHRILPEDKANWELANKLKDEAQNTLNHRGTSFINDVTEKMSFLKFFEEKLTVKNNSTYDVAYKELNKYTNGKLSFAQVDLTFLNKFRDYLKSHSKKSDNTVITYVNRMKIIWNEARKERFTSRNPFEFLSLPKKNNPDKVYLFLDDVKLLAKIKFEQSSKEQVRKAFLFSCFTGMRRGDVLNLEWSNISDDLKQVKFRPIKSKKKILTIPLHPTAKKILESLERRNDKVFHLLNISRIMTHIKKIGEKAKLSKPITFHVARHSCATILYEHGVDLYTISKILGHSNIDITKIYTHLREDKKEEAINKIPEIDIFL